MKTRRFFLACACALAGCSQRTPEKPIPAVRVEAVTSGTGASGKVVYSAVAQAETTVSLAFRGPGYVTELMSVRTLDGRSRAIGGRRLTHASHRRAAGRSSRSASPQTVPIATAAPATVSVK